MKKKFWKKKKKAPSFTLICLNIKQRRFVQIPTQKYKHCKNVTRFILIHTNF